MSKHRLTPEQKAERAATLQTIYEKITFFSHGELFDVTIQRTSDGVSLYVDHELEDGSLQYVRHRLPDGNNKAILEVAQAAAAALVSAGRTIDGRQD